MNGVGTRDHNDFAARWLAYMLPILYLNHERVAAVMGLNPKTLRKHYRDELHRAKLEVDIAVGQTYAAIPAGGHRYRRTGSGPSNGAQTNGGCWVSERRRVPKPNYFGRKALPQQTFLERDRGRSCVWRAWPPRTPCLNQHPGKRKPAA